MQTEEDIIGDSYIDENGNTVEPGYIPRPTDQRVNFSLFFLGIGFSLAIIYF